MNFTIPMLFLAIHNGHQMSEHTKEKIGISDTERMREEDPFTERFISDKENHIIQYTSRFEYDLNRHPSKAVYQRPDDCWGLNIYPETALSDEEIKEALNQHNMFYQQLDTTIEKFLNRHDNILIWDIHSYNHKRGGVDAPFDSDDENPEIILGTNHYKYMGEKWKPLVDRIENKIRNIELDYLASPPLPHNRSLSQKHLDVRQNIKFPGGYLSQYLNHKYSGRVCCIAVEFKKIWMNEWTQEIDEKALCELKAIFDKMCMEILNCLCSDN